MYKSSIFPHLMIQGKIISNLDLNITPNLRMIKCCNKQKQKVMFMMSRQHDKKEKKKFKAT